MPNAKVLSEKQAIVAALSETLKEAAAGVLVDYKGITVAEDTALRNELRENNVEYAVVKNTLTRFAIVIKAIAEKGGEAAPAEETPAAEAPAEEAPAAAEAPAEDAPAAE